MRNKQAQKLLNKAVKLKHGDKIPLFKGIYINERKKNCIEKLKEIKKEG